MGSSDPSGSSKKRKKSTAEKEEGSSKKKRKASVGGSEEAEDAAAEKGEKTYEERIVACSCMAKPMCRKKQTKKAHKLVKKASGAKCVRRGVKEVIKGLRKGVKGVCILAGDISPFDVITHLPVYCEEQGVPYMYVPSKVDLGGAASTKRPTSCVLISPPKSGTFAAQELFDEFAAICKEEEGQIPRA